MIKLNVGCNDVIFKDWVNMDIYPYNGAIKHDARSRFPYDDNSIDFIYNEHFIEHLTSDEGIKYFKECYRILKPSGVVRTSTFNIDELMLICSSDEKWENSKNIYLSGQYKHLTRTQFFNFAIYEGNAHKHMYNPDELTQIMRESGFLQFNYPQKRISNYPELCNLEWRSNSNCIVEGVK